MNDEIQESKQTNYSVMCIMPSMRYLFVDSSGYRVIVSDEADSEPTFPSNQVIYVIESVSDIDNFESRKKVSLSMDDFMNKFSLNYTNRLIFQHEQDFRDLQYLNYDINQDNNSEEDHIIKTLFDSERENFLNLSYSDDLYVAYVNDEIGYGLFTSTDLEVGFIIGEYTGIVSSSACSHRQHYSDYCVLYPSTDGAYQIDAKEYGNITRFINHSSAPNAQFQPILERNLFHILCVVISKVSAGSQLTINYGKSYWHRRGIDPEPIK